MTLFIKSTRPGKVEHVHQESIRRVLWSCGIIERRKGSRLHLLLFIFNSYISGPFLAMTFLFCHRVQHLSVLFQFSHRTEPRPGLELRQIVYIFSTQHIQFVCQSNWLIRILLTIYVDCWHFICDSCSEMVLNCWLTHANCSCP